MAFSKVGPHYDNGDEVLVYIRRLNGNTPPPGNWSSFDYYVMSALPTNDNPRYSTYNVPDDFTYNVTDGYYQNQDILTERYYKYKFGPSDIKIQTGIYPPAYGNMSNTLADNNLNPDISLRAIFPPTGDGRIVYRSLREEVRDPFNNIIKNESGSFSYDAVFTDLQPIKEKSSLNLTLTEYDATGGYLSTGPQFKFDLHVNFWNYTNGEEVPKIPQAPKDAMKVELLDKAYETPVIVQIKLMPSGSKDETVGKYPVFYHYYNASTGIVAYDYIPYRRYQVPELETPSQLRTPPSVNPAMDFISYTGLPVVSFRYNLTNNPVVMNEAEFNKLPKIASFIPINSGFSWTMPQTVDQVGQIKMQDKKLKVTYTDYKMEYPPTYRYLTFESLEFGEWESRWTIKNDPKDNDPIYITSGVTEYLNGSQIWDNEFVKRRNAGPQNRGLPLHEINSTTNTQISPRMHFQGVDCKATHLAYKIGDRKSVV